jgi:PST family polysaccharide transporter/lipopolysaccharide exporter
MAVTLSASADPFARAVLGEKWLPMAGTLTVLGIWAAVRGVQVTQTWILNAMGNQDLTAKIWAALFSLLVPSLVLAAVYGSIQTVAWVVFGNGVLALVTHAVAVNRRLAIPAREQWRSVRAAAYAAPVAWCAAWVTQESLSGIAAFAELALCVAAGLVAYGAVVSATEPGLMRETARRVIEMLGPATWRPMAKGRAR